MRGSKCRRTVLRASTDPSQRGYLIVNRHSAIEVKSRPEIKPYSCKVLREPAGEDISARAMMDYFKSPMAWLEDQNKGRQIGWE
jgi:hypothetical protein